MNGTLLTILTVRPRRGDGPWNREAVTLYCQYLLPDRYFADAIEALHPGAEFIISTQHNYDQRARFKPPADQVVDYTPTGKLYL